MLTIILATFQDLPTPCFWSVGICPMCTLLLSELHRGCFINKQKVQSAVNYQPFCWAEKAWYYASSSHIYFTSVERLATYCEGALPSVARRVTGRALRIFQEQYLTYLSAASALYFNSGSWCRDPVLSFTVGGNSPTPANTPPGVHWLWASSDPPCPPPSPPPPSLTECRSVGCPESFEDTRK